MTKEDVEAAKKNYPNALILVHPEAVPDLIGLADFVGSTTEIMEFAKKSKHKEFIIGTENNIVEHLQFDCPDKSFYPLSKKTVCHDMRITTLVDVYNAIKGTCGKEIILDNDTIQLARKPINRMIELGK